MTWLTPMIAGIAAAIAIPSLLVLYFLKLRRRDVEVSTTLLWKKSIEDIQANAPFQRLRKNLLLLLQLLALALGLLALGQPEIRTDTSPGGRIVIVVDRSASMSTLDAASDEGDAATRLQRAKEDALALVDSMQEPSLLSPGGRGGDEAMLIAFDAGAEVVQSFTDDKERLRQAIRAIEATDAPSSLDEAMRLAGAYAQPTLIEGQGLIERPGAPIHLFSDGRLPDAGSISINRETAMTFHGAGGSGTENLGITALRAERKFDDPQAASVFVGVQSTATERRSVDVEFSVDGVVSAIRTLELPAMEQTPGGEPTPVSGGVVFKLNRSKGAIVSARLLSEDALEADEQAWLALPPARRLAVLYVAPESTMLEYALEATDPARLVVAQPAEFERLVEEGGDAAFDVIVLDGWAPEEELPPGRFLTFGATPRIEGVSFSGVDGETQVAIDWARDHPALRSVSMENLLLTERIEAQAGDAAEVLAESDRGPILIEAADGPTRALIAPFSVSQTNWIWDHNLVLFVASALQHLGEETTRLTAGAASPGGVLTTRLPNDARDVELRLPDGETVTLRPGPDGRVNYGPVRDAGLYRLRWSGSPGERDAMVNGRAERFIAANLLDAQESDVRAAASLELASRSVEAEQGGGATKSTLKLWPWLVLAALGMLMIEWFVYNRKVQI